MKQLILARFTSSTSAVATAHCHHALISQAMRTLLILVSWLTVFGSQQLVQAQQILCQQQFGQVVPQQGNNLLFTGGQTSISPDSALLYRLTAPSGINAGSALQAGLMWLKRGSCDTARFASLAVKQMPSGGSLGLQSTFLLATRRGQIRVLNTVAGSDSNRIQLYAFTRRGQLRWVRTYASHMRRELAQGLSEAHDGGCYISTISKGSPPVPITSLLKVDSLGQVQWQRSYASSKNGGLTPSRTFGFFRPVYTTRGNLLLAGTWSIGTIGIGSYGLVLEVNQRGDSLTSQSFPANKPANVSVLVTSVRRLRDGGFLVVSRLDSTASPNSLSFCGFTRFNVNLQEQWTYIYRPTSPLKFIPPEVGQGLELADGSLLATINLYSTQANSLRLVHLSATGQLLQEYILPSTSFRASSLIPLAADSSFVLSGGESSGLATIMQLRIPGLRRVLAEPPLPPAQVFLATRPLAAAFPAPAYPNPATESLTVPLLPGQPAGQLTLLDLAGRRVLAQPVAAGATQATLAVGAVAAGTYLLRYERPGQPPATQRLTVGR
jgi:hypothetical protein